MIPFSVVAALSLLYFGMLFAVAYYADQRKHSGRSLIDNPKASTLGLHRALYYNEQEGHLETFRPYALPTTEWLEETENHLKRLLQPAAILHG